MYSHCTLSALVCQEYDAFLLFRLMYRLNYRSRAAVAKKRWEFDQQYAWRRNSINSRSSSSGGGGGGGGGSSSSSSSSPDSTHGRGMGPVSTGSTGSTGTGTARLACTSLHIRRTDKVGGRCISNPYNPAWQQLPGFNRTFEEYVQNAQAFMDKQEPVRL
jgi:hypothetical protein